MSEKTVKVRIAIAVCPNGEWSAFGLWRMNDEQKKENTFVDDFAEGSEQFYFIEAEVPLPHAQVIKGAVSS